MRNDKRILKNANGVINSGRPVSNGEVKFFQIRPDVI